MGELDKRLRAAVYAGELTTDEVQSWVAGAPAGAPDVLPAAEPKAAAVSKPGGEGESEKRSAPLAGKKLQKGTASPQAVPLSRLRASAAPGPPPVAEPPGAGIDWAFRVPRQLILTAKQASMSEFPPKVRRNVEKTLALNPGIKVLWLGDKACSRYIRDNYDKDLAQIFEGETRGSYRGDICRAAVLAKEGGFYVDLDVELRLPFHELIDAKTTFMSAYTEDGEILNAVLAAPPKSSVMRETVRQIRSLYRGRSPVLESGQWMGPTTLWRALDQVIRTNCKGDSMDFHQGELQWACGQHRIRLYHERHLRCGGGPAAEAECPPSRASSNFLGVQFGLFAPGEDRQLIGWPRFAGCSEWGCKAGGWDVAKDRR